MNSGANTAAGRVSKGVPANVGVGYRQKSTALCLISTWTHVGTL